MDLKGYQRSALVKQSHSLPDLILVGQKGLSAEVVKALDETLDSHELVKMRFNDFKEQKRELLLELPEALQGELVRVTGNVALFYRPFPDKGKRKVNLPLRKIN